MGRYLSINLRPMDSNWNSYCKINYFIILLKKSPSFETVDLQRYSSAFAPHHSRYAHITPNAQDCMGSTQWRCLSQQASKQDVTTTAKAPTDDKEKDAGFIIREKQGLQLFHISSLATRFGESFNYIAGHINSAFSLGFSKMKVEDKGQITKGDNIKQMWIKMQPNHVMSSKETESPLKSCADQATMELNSNKSWEDGYVHFARHINKYFGAKVADDAGCQSQPKSSTQSSSRNQVDTTQHSQNPIGPEIGLFHKSHNTTNFGENHSQMANHINHFFKAATSLDDTGWNLKKETKLSAAKRQKKISLIDCFRHPSRAIPDLLGLYLNESKPPLTSPDPVISEKLYVSHKQAEGVFHALLENLRGASSAEVLTTYVEMLNEHLRHHPSCKALMWQEKMPVTLLRHRRVYRDKQELQKATREALALIGYVDPVKGRGIKVLSIDGGGTRGVVPLQVLKLLEAQTGKKIHQLFDYICGVSTGAVLAFMLGLAHFSLEECTEMYRRFGSEVFRQNRLVGTVKMGWSHSYYNTETWETLLREKLGDRVLIKTVRDEASPKVSAVSAVVNWGNSPKAFVFCNYNHKPGSLSRYAGGSGYSMWQAVRASSAAPGYFQEFPLQSDIHQDGGIIMNNPCALAVHESRLLWPNHAFQCVLSLGTGRYDNAKRGPVTSTSLRAKISNLISSATDTEGVHTLLDDLLPPDVYFRFNPMLSAEVSLDESRPGALDQLEMDTQVYLERNRLKLVRLCLVLGAERSAVDKTKDWINERAWEMKHRLF
ncbi:calcium-independent phospholipase A2-gamma-like isoform X1 [Stigmatopora nigra]